MQIKAFHVFRVVDNDTIKTFRSKVLEEALSDFPACDPVSSQWRRMGFVVTVEQAEEPEYAFEGPHGSRAMCIELRERVLPANTVNRIVRERAEKLAAQQGYKVNKRDYAQIKDDVIQDLLPRSHIKSSRSWLVYYGGYLIVGTSSPKACDEIIATLADAVRTKLPKRPFKLERFDVTTAATRWLTDLAFNGQDIRWRGIHQPQDQEDCPEDLFVPREAATLYSSGKDGGLMKVKDIPMDSDSVVEKLNEGWLVKDMAVQWEDSLLFTLTHSCIFKGFKFSDIVINEKLDEENEASAVQALDSALALFCGHVYKMLGILQEGFELIQPRQVENDVSVDGEDFCEAEEDDDEL